jgi:hypothetical protein
MHNASTYTGAYTYVYPLERKNIQFYNLNGFQSYTHTHISEDGGTGDFRPEGATVSLKWDSRYYYFRSTKQNQSKPFTLPLREGRGRQVFSGTSKQ